MSVGKRSQRLAASTLAIATMSSVIIPMQEAQAQTNQVTPAPSNVYQPGKQNLGADETNLTRAAADARNAGIRVTQQATQNQTVSKYDAEQAISDAKASYRTQTTTIRNAITAWNKTKADHDAAMKSYNDLKRNYDNAVKARDEAVAERNRLIADNERISVENEQLRRAYDEAVVAYDRLMAEYNRAVELRAQIERENAAIEQRNQPLLDAYQRSLDTYNARLAEYNEKKSFYDKAMAGQIGDSVNPNVALSPEYILVNQPFEIIESREDFVLDGGNSAGRRERIEADKRWHSRGNNNCSGTLREGDLFPWNRLWETYNSSFASACSVRNGDSVRGTWLDRAVDKESGRKLDLTITVSDIVIDSSRPQHPGNTRPNGGQAQVYFYSNSVDNIGLENVVHAKKTYSYRYADTLEPYNKPYYLTIGSLDWSRIMEGSKEAGVLAEFTAPGQGVMASFVGAGSYIKPTLQTVYGPASSRLSRAFYVDHERLGDVRYPSDIYYHEDDKPEVFQKIGVTYLVNNGAQIHVGDSYTGTRWREIRQDNANGSGGFNYSHIYNHIMSSYATVAPQLGEPVRPTAPTPPQLEPLKPLPSIPQRPATPQLRQIPLNELPPIPSVPEEPRQPVLPAAPAVSYQLRNINVMERGQLKVNKEVSNQADFYFPGSDITFTLEITNDGQDVLNNVILTDDMVSGLEPGSFRFTDTAGKPVNGNSVNVGTLNSGDTLRMTATAKIDDDAVEGDRIVNRLRGTSPDDPTKGPETDIQVNPDLPSDTDGSDEVEVTVAAAPDSEVEVIKYINGDDANNRATAAGLGTDAETMEVSYVITNRGDTVLNNIRITDNIPEINDLLTNATSDKGNNGSIRLAPGESTTITLSQVTSPEVATYHSNIGTVVGTPDDPRIPRPTPDSVTDEDPAWAFRYPFGGVNLPNTGSVGLVGLGSLLLAVLGGIGFLSFRRNNGDDLLNK